MVNKLIFLKRLLFNFIALQFLKHWLLLYFMLTDEQLYLGIMNRPSNELNNKITIFIASPVIMYLLTFIFMLILKKRLDLNLNFTILLFVTSILLYYNFDFRTLFFFISNHRVKLYLSLTTYFCYFLSISLLIKKNNLPK